MIPRLGSALSVLVVVGGTDGKPPCAAGLDVELDFGERPQFGETMPPDP
jgi:hypothetical protein